MTNSKIDTKAAQSALKNTSIYSLHIEEIENWIDKQNENRYRIQQFIDHIYTQRKPLESLSTWPKNLRDKLRAQYDDQLKEILHQISKDNTHKWLYKLADNNSIETVLMEYKERATVCVSSQAGCAMGCTFCATGQGGFFRQLSSSEIIEQVAKSCHVSTKRVSNIVFMGMGEPLANTKNVYLACKYLIKNFGFSPRHITISTVGIVPGIEEMSTWDLPITLAISLHSAFDELRSELVPINKRYPIADVIKAAQKYSQIRSRRVSFEYAAIAEKNTTNECAHECGKLLRNFSGAGGAHLNIIPLNRTRGYSSTGANHKDIATFAKIVQNYGVTVTIRQNRGTDIDAACGQLHERYIQTN